MLQPPLAGLADERQRRQPAHPLVGRRRHLGLRWAGAQVEHGHRLEHRLRPGAREVHAQPEPEREQVPHRDRPGGGDRLAVDGTVRIDQHPPVGELRQQVVDRLVEPEPALLDEDEGCDGDDRLGHRRDAEERVAAHWFGLAAGQGAATPTSTSSSRDTSQATPPTVSRPRSGPPQAAVRADARRNHHALTDVIAAGSIGRVRSRRPPRTVAPVRSLGDDPHDPRGDHRQRRAELDEGRRRRSRRWWPAPPARPRSCRRAQPFADVDAEHAAEGQAHDGHDEGADDSPRRRPATPTVEAPAPMARRRAPRTRPGRRPPRRSSSPRRRRLPPRRSPGTGRRRARPPTRGTARGPGVPPCPPLPPPSRARRARRRRSSRRRPHGPEPRTAGTGAPAAAHPLPNHPRGCGTGSGIVGGDDRAARHLCPLAPMSPALPGQ